MSDDDDTRAIYRSIKRIPRRPLSATILIIVVGFFVVTSKSRDFDEETALSRAQTHIQQEYLGRCGFEADLADGFVRRVETESGRFERYEVRQSVRLPSGVAQDLNVWIWADLTIGPRVPLGDGDYFTLLEFDENIELRDPLPTC